MQWPITISRHVLKKIFGVFNRIVIYASSDVKVIVFKRSLSWEDVPLLGATSSTGASRRLFQKSCSLHYYFGNCKPSYGGSLAALAVGGYYLRCPDSGCGRCNAQLIYCNLAQSRPEMKAQDHKKVTGSCALALVDDKITLRLVNQRLFYTSKAS